MDSITPQEFDQVELFATDLIRCYEARLKDSIDDWMAKVALRYAINIIKIHLELKELELKQYGINLEKYLAKDN